MGILHLDNLKPAQLEEFLTNIDKWEYTEKIDGANLQVEKVNDKLVISRSIKGGNQYTELSDWPDRSWTVNFKQAHSALMKSNLIDFMENGDKYDLEVLGTPQPNVIDYELDHSSIVFLRVLSGNPNYRKFLQQCVNIETNELVHYSDSDAILTKRFERKNWKFFEVKKYDSTYFDIESIRPAIETIINKLHSKILIDGRYEFTVAEILNFKFNKIPKKISKAQWPYMKTLIKDEQIHLEYQFTRAIIPTITIPLLKSFKGTNTFGNNSTMEGLVISYNNHLAKLIEVEDFTKRNNLTWEYPSHFKMHLMEIETDIANTIQEPNLKYPHIKKKRAPELTKSDFTRMNKFLKKDSDLLVAKFMWIDAKLKTILKEYQTLTEITEPNKYSKYTIDKHYLHFADTFDIINRIINNLMQGDTQPVINYLLKLGEMNEHQT